jgi:hypothetical protein
MPIITEKGVGIKEKLKIAMMVACLKQFVIVYG